ncbi:DUF2330 domain-containing protein [Candidatus Bathyarchaeota archaeon]|nr:DUF2330 domain-containing protein [Candidatus Bathyarchaeota archaeon]MBS7617401.1 DUF2330 domain-containing protein [Candidatus Bathyarchaeota archaeon]
MNWKTLGLSALLLSISLLTQPTLCDRGVIPVEPAVVYQSGQLATIAWKDGEEILIISTSLYVRPTLTETPLILPQKPLYALEFIPLPSIPEVEEGDLNVFRLLESIIRTTTQTVFYEPNLREASSKTVEVIYHEIIGVHEINILKADSGKSTAEWVLRFLSNKSFPKPLMLEELSSIVDAYLIEGYSYLVFDLISLSTTLKTVKPLVYKFRSEKIYYPLKASSIINGYSSITLYLLTADRVKPESVEPSGLKIAFEAKISRSNVEKADKRLADFFSEDVIWLTVLTWNGYLSELTGDLKAEVGFSIIHLKNELAFSAPISTALILTALVYVYEFRNVLKRILRRTASN